MLAYLIVLGLIDGASGAAEPPTPPAIEVQTGAPGYSRPWIAYINGKRVQGDYWLIKAMVESLAKEVASKDIAQQRTTKKPRIVVEPGKVVKTAAASEIQAVSESAGREIQENIRNFYKLAYAKAKMALEQDEEDSLMVLL